MSETTFCKTSGQTSNITGTATCCTEEVRPAAHLKLKKKKNDRLYRIEPFKKRMTGINDQWRDDF